MNQGASTPTSLTPITLITTTGNTVPVQVEIANNDHSRTQGLMFRRELPPQQGMLFVFPSTIDHGFWMKNTYIPLDMIFIDQHQRIVGIIESAEPMTLSQQSVHAPSRYVLEVNGGFSQIHGITVGSTVQIPAGVSSALQ